MFIKEKKILKENKDVGSSGIKMNNERNNLSSKKGSITRGINVIDDLAKQIAEERIKGSPNKDETNCINFEYED